MVSWFAFSFYFCTEANTTLERRSIDRDNRRQHKTNRHNEHSAQPVLPLPCLLACLCSSSSCLLACRSLASASSISLYLSHAALSRPNCSARSLNLTCSNCQGPFLLGGIERDGEGGWRGGGQQQRLEWRARQRGKKMKFSNRGRDAIWAIRLW